MPSHEPSEVMSAGPSSLRILIADDDRDSVLTLELLLRQEGHAVRSVHSGREVMKAVLDFNPEVVLLDIALPPLSGWELGRMIREQFGHRVVLIGISGKYNLCADNILSDLVGFDHYVLKPYDPKALIALITLIARQHLQSGRVQTGAL
ncbi:MAG TPA: response regulator [Blastocatellia bacterium]|nr:response regulator [Blastocatellia bacterium]